MPCVLFKNSFTDYRCQMYQRHFLLVNAVEEKKHIYLCEIRDNEVEVKISNGQGSRTSAGAEINEYCFVFVFVGIFVFVFVFLMWG